ncbi:MAG: pilus assembly protein PilM [Clostridiales bacterium]|nr:pilus assembly protein PilM [Clostridiales bacterium]
MGKIKTVIGFEMDSVEIRAVELMKSGSSYSVVAFGKMALSQGTVEEGFIRKPEEFQEALSSLIKDNNFSGQDVIIGVNNENVIMRYASFPKVTPDKLRKVVLLQAQEFIPIPVNELEIDFVLAGESKNDDDQPMSNVLLVAARTTMLEQLTTLFSAAKLQVVDIDSSMLAWLRAAQSQNGASTFGLLKITDDMLNFIALSKGELKMVRSLAVPERAARQVKDAFTYGTSILPEDIETIGDMLAGEISSSLGYYQMQGFDPIEVIYFSAEIKTQNEVADRMRASSYVPIVVPEFYSDIQAPSADFAAKDYIGCLSLAMQALEG